MRRPTQTREGIWDRGKVTGDRFLDEKVEYSTTIWFYSLIAAGEWVIKDYRYVYGCEFDPLPIPGSTDLKICWLDSTDGCHREVTVAHYFILFTDADPDPPVKGVRQGAGVVNGRPGLQQPFDQGVVARAICGAQ